MLYHESPYHQPVPVLALLGTRTSWRFSAIRPSWQLGERLNFARENRPMGAYYEKPAYWRTNARLEALDCYCVRPAPACRGVCLRLSSSHHAHVKRANSGRRGGAVAVRGIAFPSGSGYITITTILVAGAAEANGINCGKSTFRKTAAHTEQSAGMASRDRDSLPRG